MSATIIRCVHDKKNPYTIVSNDLLDNNDLSPACRFLIIYLLRKVDHWNISPMQLIDEISNAKGKRWFGEKKIYALLNEAIQAGYIKKEVIKQRENKNLQQGVCYILSETPQFKEENAIKSMSPRGGKFRDRGNCDHETPLSDNLEKIDAAHIEEQVQNKKQLVIGMFGESDGEDFVDCADLASLDALNRPRVSFSSSSKDKKGKETPEKTDPPEKTMPPDSQMPEIRAETGRKAHKKRRECLGSRIKFDRNTRQFNGILEEDIEMWKKSHPNVNVRLEITKAETWMYTHPYQAARKKDGVKFLTNWMNRASEGYKGAQQDKPKHTFYISESREYKDLW